MKKLLLSLFIATLSTNSNLYAQEENTSRTAVIMYGGIGYGKVINSDEPNYNISTNTAELLVNYRFSKSAGIAAGLGFSELSGSGFNTGGNFYHERSALKIPVVLTMNINTGNRSQYFAQVGPYAQTTLQDRQTYLTTINNDVYKGWNFGVQLGVGMTYTIFDNLSLGIQLLTQSDFTDQNASTHPNIQKIKNVSSFGMLLKYDL